jgi:hypothetical protein
MAADLDLRYYGRNDITHIAAKASDKADQLVVENTALTDALRGVRGGAELRKRIARANRLAEQLAKVQDEIYRELRD